MIVQRTVTAPAMVLGAIGLALLFAAFLLLVPVEHRGAVAWLDLAVCSAAFLVNFATLPFVRPRAADFSGEIPKMGILWTTHLSYTSLALAGVYYGWIWDIGLRMQLVYQAAILFGLVVVVSVAGGASGHAAAIAAGEQRQRAGLDTLKRSASDCQSAFARAGGAWASEQARFQALRDDIRYLSPCDNESAVSLDLEMASLIDDISAAVSGSSTAARRGSEVCELLARCETLLGLRRLERKA